MVGWPPTRSRRPAATISSGSTPRWRHYASLRLGCGPPRRATSRRARARRRQLVPRPFDFGLYLCGGRRRRRPRGEVEVFYDHRRDQSAGPDHPGSLNGFIGHVGIDAVGYRVRGGQRRRRRGSAWVFQLGLRRRFERCREGVAGAAIALAGCTRAAEIAHADLEVGTASAGGVAIDCRRRPRPTSARSNRARSSCGRRRRCWRSRLDVDTRAAADWTITLGNALPDAILGAEAGGPRCRSSRSADRGDPVAAGGCRCPPPAR